MILTVVLILLGIVLAVPLFYILWFCLDWIRDIDGLRTDPNYGLPTDSPWADLEDENRRQALAALTPLDVEILTGLGWEPTDDVRKRIELHKKNESYRRSVERREEIKAKKAAAAAVAYVPMTPEELEAYKRRPLAVRQAEANESITGDPTVYGRFNAPSVGTALANLAAAGISTDDLVGWDALHVAERREPVAYISPDGYAVYPRYFA